MTLIHILGSASCFPSKLQKGRKPAGYLVTWGKNRLLLDCSQGIAERLEKIGIRPDEIAHCAISHAHPDHFALPQFLQSSLCSRMLQPGFSWDDPKTFSELNLYAGKHITKYVSILHKIYFEETVTVKSAGLPFPILHTHTLPSEQSIELPEGAKLQGFRVHHGFGKVDALAFRLTLSDGTIIVYSGDTGMCDGLITAAQNADVFICEAGSRIGDTAQAREYGHLTPRQAGEVAAQAGVKTIVLTHYFGFDSVSDMKKDCRLSGFEGKIIVATDGMKIKV